MALDKGLALLLRALGDVSYPDDYGSEDEARDFFATFLGDDPTRAKLRTLGRILSMGGYFDVIDGRAVPHSAEPIQHREGARVLCGEIVNALRHALSPPQPPVSTDAS